MKDKLAELPAVILAAGRGYRLQSEEHIMLKPLMPVLGLTMLERSLLTCRQAGIREFTVVVGYRKHELLRQLEEVRKNPACPSVQWKTRTGRRAMVPL
jgi:NDP-sugar pyrophosphorylase family protein